MIAHRLSTVSNADKIVVLKEGVVAEQGSGAFYPAILTTTADTDDRVVPAHSFKYVATLQAADIGDRPHLLRVETQAGHGAGKPIDKVIDEVADRWAFAAHWTGLEVAGNDDRQR